jgi:hypothetical protein
MSVIGSNILAGASGQGGGYNLTNSLRFRSSASATLTRTPATASDRRTFTWSGWVKRGALVNGDLFSANANGVSYPDNFGFGSDKLVFYPDGGTSAGLTTVALYRDPSAWYHIVFASDTTQATNTNRIKVYVNGVQQTLTGTYPTQNYQFSINSVIKQIIGDSETVIGGTTYHNYLDAYLTEVNFIDGQALTPSSFGSTNSATGVWQPKKYAGTYGTNGFYLPFTDNASTTTLGNDFSGNGNNWTTNNISLTAGSTYDSMTDVPTLTSATASNFAVLNPLQLGSGCSLSNANLSGTNNANSRGLTSTIHASAGKFYWEVNPTSGTNQTIGVVDSTFPPNIDIFSSGYNTCGYYVSGEIYLNGSVSTTVASYSTSDTIGVALNCDTNQVTFYKNNTSQATITLTSGISWKAFLGNGSGAQAQSYNINFGQRPFAYTPPTGFVALNTFNLP